MTANMKRRNFIALLGGAAAAWSVAARAQQPERVRRIGTITSFAADDQASQPRLAAFRQGLQQLGWTEGRNVIFEARWAAGDAERIRRGAAELVALAPDVILAATSPSVAALLQVTRTVPIVFVQVADPVGAGSLRAWRSRAAMPPDSPSTNTLSARNGWNCSRRSRRM
jgi:putative ABC transport system substrate-binding protein